jgi:hypothetical protein
MTPNIIQTMKHTVKASVLTTSTDRAWLDRAAPGVEPVKREPAVVAGFDGMADMRRMLPMGRVARIDLAQGRCMWSSTPLTHARRLV